MWNAGIEMSEYKVLTAGDTALVVEFGDRVDRKLSSFVLALARRLDEIRLDGIVETVPTFRSLMVHYDPLVISADALVARIVDLMKGLRTVDHGSREWRLPVCYDPELALDLGDVAARTGLTPARVIELHASVTYHVYMLGFMPGFAYMGDVPADLVLARREMPRPRVAGGLGRDRDHDVNHLPARKPDRMARHRALARGAVAADEIRHRTGRAAGAGRQGDLRADFTSRIP